MIEKAVNGAPFITLEGGEGSGKSTQIKLLSDWLVTEGIEHICTREPGGAPGAEQIRNLVLTGDVDRWTPMTEVLLYTAARSDHVERVIVPTLKQGKWVLCDRFTDSSIAYQGAARGVGVEKVRALQQLVLGDLKPDLTLILDLPVGVGLSRAVSRETDKSEKTDKEDRFERMEVSLHEATRKVFLDIAERSPDRCVVVDADQSVEALQECLRQLIASRFSILGFSNG